jgi:hypothetical protein
MHNHLKRIQLLLTEEKKAKAPKPSRPSLI